MTTNPVWYHSPGNSLAAGAKSEGTGEPGNTASHFRQETPALRPSATA